MDQNQVSCEAGEHPTKMWIKCEPNLHQLSIRFIVFFLCFGANVAH